jgi:hypothetical protein
MFVFRTKSQSFLTQYVPIKQFNRLSYIGHRLKNNLQSKKTTIKKDEIIAHQNKWGSGLVNIGNLYSSGGDHVKYTEKFIEDMYCDFPDVLFKPTKASKVKFRNSYSSTLSYFITGSIPEDTGFALESWSKVTHKNHLFLIRGDNATVMGEYKFESNKTQKTIIAEYTFGYLKSPECNKLKIYLQHSSIPYKI